jgi:hypothetical protein
MSTATITKSQDEFNQELAEFFVEWTALSFEEKEAPISTPATPLQERAEQLMSEAAARTCPPWCDKSEHREVEPGAFWGWCPDDGLITHSRHFGDGVAMGNEDESSGVKLLAYVNAVGKIIDEPCVHVEEHDQQTVAQARALGEAILEAADFWGNWQLTHLDSGQVSRIGCPKCNSRNAELVAEVPAGYLFECLDCNQGFLIPTD